MLNAKFWPDFYAFYYFLRDTPVGILLKQKQKIRLLGHEMVEGSSYIASGRTFRLVRHFNCSHLAGVKEISR